MQLKVAPVPHELIDEIKTLREVVFDWCIPFWEYHCNRYFVLKKPEYWTNDWSRCHDVCLNIISAPFCILDALVLSDIRFGKKLAYELTIIKRNTSVYAIKIQDNSLIPLPCCLWELCNINYPHIEERLEKLGGKPLYGYRFSNIYGKCINDKPLLTKAVPSVYKVLDYVLTCNGIDICHYLPPAVLPSECNIASELIFYVHLLPYLYYLFINDAFKAHSMVLVEVISLDRTFLEFGKRVYLVFSYNNEELQDVLKIESVKRLIEKMEQAISCYLLKETLSNVERFKL